MADKLTYSIAGHLFQVEGDVECAALKNTPGFPVFCVEDQEPEWKVVFGHTFSIPADSEKLYEIEDNETDTNSFFFKKDDVYYFSMSLVASPDDCPLYMRYKIGSNVVEGTCGRNPMHLRFALWMALGMMSASSNMVLIHSSCVVHQGKAVLCLGESGTGKSTHTRLWLNHIPDTHLLNDDSPVLAFENGEAVVYGSPWSGKTHCYHQLRFPLAAAIRLSQAPYNKIHRQNILSAFASVHPSFPPALSQDQHFQDLLMGLLSNVLECVPVFHLECLPDEAAAWTSHNAIFGPIK
ncbi:MAG: hypothetical protein MJZ67_04955 [Bacteroidales bacterium]|nr:hypothetical protein [Bacteroidales bacterium]